MATETNLEIIFRFLMLYYSSPDGLRVLIPGNRHRATLRDIATDSIFHLSEAHVHLEIDGQPLPAQRTAVTKNGRLISMEEPLKTDEVVPAPAFLNVPVHSELNALVEMSGGSLTAFPAMAFPEHADEVANIKFGPVNKFDSMITDTTMYQVALPPAKRAELVIASPRGTFRVDVSSGGRFELRNDDDKTGAPQNRLEIASTEFQQLLLLLDMPFKVECDYFQCLCAMCGR